MKKKEIMRKKAIELSSLGYWDAAQAILDEINGRKPKEYKRERED